jgi:dihydroxyacid dehydratase/phosphogluconate dehydratase
MKILIVNAFSDIPQGHQHFNEFVQIIQNVWDLRLVMSIND